MLKRIDILLKQERKTFHTQDLALLWNIPDRNTLLTAIKRYTKEKILYRIYKGFYSTIPIENLNPYELGICAVHDFTYLSTETVLINQGIIQQHIEYITLISGKTRIFSISGRHYKVRKLRDEFLYNETGIVKKDGIKTATVERAIADLLYYNERYFLDGNELIDHNNVKEIQKAIGYL